MYAGGEVLYLGESVQSGCIERELGMQSFLHRIQLRKDTLLVSPAFQHSPGVGG